jgi:hypothetical protein
LGDSIRKQIGEASRVPVGGARNYPFAFYNAGEQRMETLDLVGVSTGLYVESGGPVFEVSVRGALSGLDYGTYYAQPGSPVAVPIGHLPFAKLTFSVRNLSPFPGTANRISIY